MKKSLVLILSFMEFLDDTREIISAHIVARKRIWRLRPALKKFASRFYIIVYFCLLY